ncbi:iron uptake system protein EfeO [Nocardioides sp.]|uniref:iron uptake system protein EfeO n=1 Tax=Nocardioides sp. TaxID=35761 RepID=UPI00351374A5
MSSRPAHPARPLLLGLLAATALAGCGTESTAAPEAGDPRALVVTSRDDACELSAVTAPAGTLTFAVSNEGRDVTEFYLLADDGLRIIGEVENIGAGAGNRLTVTAPAGDYVAVCKPGMSGDGLRQAFTVTESDDDAPAISADDQVLIDQALAGYAAYVRDQTDQLLARTEEFVTAYGAGDDDRARALYPVARTHWERIETVAESFGDLDPRMDLREADLEPGQTWTGWHLLEKDLWPAEAEAGYAGLTPAERRRYAGQLLADTRDLRARVADLTYTVDDIANGSRGLLEEVATGKVTGEEERWSHTDLWDFQANVDGARVAFEGVAPIVERREPALAATLTERFAALQDLLDRHREGEGFVTYTALDPAEVKALADAVNALSEPLSRLTAAVV